MKMPTENTIRSLWAWLATELSGLYTESEARSIADEVFFRLFGLRRDMRILHATNCLNDTDLNRLYKAHNELVNARPVQYVTGLCSFLEVELTVNPSVLIPRPETEEMVLLLLGMNNSRDGKLRILDIGTGSGCIPIALSKRLPEASIFACDVSEASIEVAKHNALKNRTDVTFFICDILREMDLYPGPKQIDWVISNPPYIRQSEKPYMHRNVLDHEPQMALFVDDTDPLVFYRVIAERAYHMLSPGGLLMFEINENFGKETVYILNNKGYKNVQLNKDFNKKDRFVFGTR
jgi:release factor glutamine methyltransferase